MTADHADALARAARLARLDLDEDECRELFGDLESLLGAFGAISAIDTRGVEPMTGPAAHGGATRSDAIRPSLSREEALGQAPERMDAFYGVPKTIESP